MKTLTILFFIAIIFNFSACSTNKVKSQKSARERAFLYQDIGMGYLRGRNYPAALKQLLIANKLAPNEPSILNNLGVAFHYRGRVDLAQKHIEQALTINPEYTEARTNLGQILIENKKYSQALKHLLTAREDLTYPHPEKVHTNLARAYFYLANHAAAEKELNLALKVNRNYCPALTYKVKNLFYLKRYSRTYQLADHTKINCPTSTPEEMLYFGGMSFYLSGKRDQAENRFTTLIKKYPNTEYTEKAKIALKTLESEK